MDIGCHLPNQGPLATGEAVATFAREADRQGVASLWVSDHVVFPRTATGSYPGGRFPHPPDKPYLEPVVTLAAAAVCTTHARLGASVFILGHRHPVVMAKMLTSIDALSGGRLICGVGVGWWREELEMLGAPFHQRGRQADEILRVFTALWSEDNPSFEGEFFRFRNLGFAPKPVQKPRPPIWVGGDSPGAFRRVVTLGDGWHATSKSPAELREPCRVCAPPPTGRGAISTRSHCRCDSRCATTSSPGAPRRSSTAWPSTSVSAWATSCSSSVVTTWDACSRSSIS